MYAVEKATFQTLVAVALPADVDEWVTRGWGTSGGGARLRRLAYIDCITLFQLG